MAHASEQEDPLDENACSRMAEAIGVVGVEGDFGRHAEEVYAALLLEKHAARVMRQR